MPRLSSKNQVTIPVEVLRSLGLRTGDELMVRARDGVIEIEPVDHFVERYAGSLPPGTYPPGYLDALRDEWER